MSAGERDARSSRIIEAFPILGSPIAHLHDQRKQITSASLLYREHYPSLAAEVLGCLVSGRSIFSKPVKERATTMLSWGMSAELYLQDSYASLNEIQQALAEIPDGSENDLAVEYLSAERKSNTNLATRLNNLVGTDGSIFPAVALTEEIERNPNDESTQQLLEILDTFMSQAESDVSLRGLQDATIGMAVISALGIPGSKFAFVEDVEPPLHPDLYRRLNLLSKGLQQYFKTRWNTWAGVLNGKPELRMPTGTDPRQNKTMAGALIQAQVNQPVFAPWIFKAIVLQTISSNPILVNVDENYRREYGEAVFSKQIRDGHGNNPYELARDSYSKGIESYIRSLLQLPRANGIDAKRILSISSQGRQALIAELGKQMFTIDVNSRAIEYIAISTSNGLIDFFIVSPHKDVVHFQIEQENLFGGITTSPHRGKNRSEDIIFAYIAPLITPTLERFGLPARQQETTPATEVNKLVAQKTQHTSPAQLDRAARIDLYERQAARRVVQVATKEQTGSSRIKPHVIINGQLITESDRLYLEGYFGSLSDEDLLAESHILPDGRIVTCGPSMREESGLLRIPDVILIDPKPSQKKKS